MREIQATKARTQERERAAREQAVDRFLEWRASRPPTGMTREEILAARHEGHRV